MIQAEFEDLERSRAYGSQGAVWLGASEEASQRAFILTEEINRLGPTLEDVMQGVRDRDIHFEHRAVVRNALGEGRPVPPEVLAEYPKLIRTEENV